MTWADSFLRTLKENDVRLVTYVPDNVLTPLISGAADARRHRGRASHADRRGHNAFDRRQVDQASFHHAKPGGLHPVAASHRRKSGGGSQIEVREIAIVAAPTIDAPAVKVLNRAD